MPKIRANSPFLRFNLIILQREREKNGVLLSACNCQNTSVLLDLDHLLSLMMSGEIQL